MSYSRALSRDWHSLMISTLSSSWSSLRSFQMPRWHRWRSLHTSTCPSSTPSTAYSAAFCPMETPVQTADTRVRRTQYTCAMRMERIILCWLTWAAGTLFSMPRHSRHCHSSSDCLPQGTGILVICIACDDAQNCSAVYLMSFPAVML
jgi:hypothetical protein